MLEPQVNYENHRALYYEQTKLSFLIKRECFGDVFKVSSDFDALWSVAKSPKIPHIDGNPKYVFFSTVTESVISAKFQEISCRFAKFQKFRPIKERGKMLEAQVNCENHSALYHEQTKLSLLIKRECFGDVCKVSSDFDALW